jgi:hypothetical protein
MTTNLQMKAPWEPRPLEWGPSKHYGTNAGGLGARTATVAWEDTCDQNRDDN